MQRNIVVALAAALSVAGLTAGAAIADREVIVQPGDSLVTISRRYYGDEGHVWAITLANHLPSPDVIYAGQRLILPELAAGDSQRDAATSTNSGGTQSGASTTTYSAGSGPVQQPPTAVQPPSASQPGSAGRPPLPSTASPPPAVSTPSDPFLWGPSSPDAPVVGAPTPTSPQPAPADADVSPGRILQTGLATWYGPGFVGGITYCGEVYDQWALTAASNSLPCGSVVNVVNQETGATVRVRINDRGGFGGAVILDLSRAAFTSIAPATSGVIAVTVTATGQ